MRNRSDTSFGRSVPSWLRPHLASVRALGILTVVCGFVYPFAVTGIAQLPGLRDKAEGSLVSAGGNLVGSALIAQPFTDAGGKPLPQYFQPRPSAAGANGYDPTASGGSNLGPEDVVDTFPDPSAPKDSPAAAGKPSLLSQVCGRSAAAASLEGLPASAGSRPYCTAGGVGAVLAVFGPRDGAGRIATVTRVVSLNEECPAQPFVSDWRGTKVGCAKFGEDYTAGLVTPVRGDAPSNPVVPPDAVTASFSGLDPDISPAYARLQAARIAHERAMPIADVESLISAHTTGRTLGFMGEPAVNVLELNRALDIAHPAPVSPPPR